tara:strand:- start:1829 stop:2128 length:300 start_codon:yes stop_codon:yes gene_type:complete
MILPAYISKPIRDGARKNDPLVPVLIGPILIAFIARVPVRFSTAAAMAAMPATATATVPPMAKKMQADERHSDQDPNPVLRKPSHFSFPLRDWGHFVPG